MDAAHSDCADDCCWPARLQAAGGPTPIRPLALAELDRRDLLPHSVGEAAELLARFERDATRTDTARTLAGLLRRLVEAVDTQATARAVGMTGRAELINTVRTATTEVLDTGIPLSLVLETVQLPDCALKVPFTVYLGLEADVRDGCGYAECIQRWGVGRGLVAKVKARHGAWMALTDSQGDVGAGRPAVNPPYKRQLPAVTGGRSWDNYDGATPWVQAARSTDLELDDDGSSATGGWVA